MIQNTKSPQIIRCAPEYWKAGTDPKKACRMIKPKFKRFAEENEGVEFVIVDAEKFPQSRQLANVNNLPTFAAFEDGEFKNQIQTNKVDVLKNFIDEVSQ